MSIFFAKFGTSNTPEFEVYPAGEERKQAFVDYFLPIIESENQRISKERTRLLELSARADLGFFDRRWVVTNRE